MSNGIESMTNFANFAGALMGREDERREKREERTFEYAMAQWMQDAQTARQANQQKLGFVMDRLAKTEDAYKKKKADLDNLGILEEALQGVKNKSSAAPGVIEQEAKDLSRFMSELDVSKGSLQEAIFKIQKENNAMDARLGSLQEMESRYKTGSTNPLIADIMDFAKAQGPDFDFNAEEMNAVKQKYLQSGPTDVLYDEKKNLASDPIAWKGALNTAREQLLKRKEVEISEGYLNSKKDAMEMSKLALMLRLKSGTTMSPYERALQMTQGRKTGEAQFALGDVGNIAKDVFELFSRYTKIPSNLKGPGVGGTVMAPLTRLSRQNQELTGYYSLKDFILSNISRQLGGERGVLTQQDIERVKKLLPDARDTDDTAKIKVRQTLEFVDRRVKTKQKQAKQEEIGIGIDDVDWETVLQNPESFQGMEPSAMPGPTETPEGATEEDIYLQMMLQNSGE